MHQFRLLRLLLVDQCLFLLRLKYRLRHLTCPQFLQLLTLQHLQFLQHPQSPQHPRILQPLQGMKRDQRDLPFQQV